LAFPTLDSVIWGVLVLVVGVVVVYLLSRALKIRPKSIAIEGLRRETVAVLLVIVALLVARFALDTSGKFAVLPTSPLYGPPGGPPPAAVDVLWYALVSAIYTVIVILAIKRTGQSLGSIGITGVDKWRNLILGLVLSAIYLGAYLGAWRRAFPGFSVSLVYTFIFSAIVGFSQEIVWRGYVQTRLTAKVGTIMGLVATALVFAFWHFPMTYFAFSGVGLEALAEILMKVPASLLLGYIMLKSQNIIPGSIFHLFWDFSLIATVSM